MDRLSYSWVSPLLTFAATHKSIELEDLPEMNHLTRARQLYDAFTSQIKSHSLAKRLIKSHAPAIFRVYILTVFASALGFAPQFALFRILKLLEARQAGKVIEVGAMVWAVGLGLIMLLKTVIENWMWFMSRNHIHTPLMVQLSSIIFSKAMGRKDIQAVPQVPQKLERDPDALPSSYSEESSPASEPDQKNSTHQGTINLIAVDSKRIAEFCIFQNEYLGIVGKIVISCVFLTRLIGWQAFLAGILVQFLTIPLNIHFSRSYTNAQGELMNIRDTKLSILNEALLGMRQIKLSALEAPRYSTIMNIREKELAIQYKAFFADNVMVFCWLAGPVLLSAISIVVYVLLHGSLSASVAFTTISVLNTLQGTLAWIPELTTQAINAWISVRRIEKFLDAPEKEDNTFAGDTVKFCNATISWPSDTEMTHNMFLLTDLNLTFPRQELSIISGPTGSGKSLLLAAILGEQDLLNGTIMVPMPASNHNQPSTNASISNWLIPSAMAFVSQRPWVENRSFRENILFGLPFYEDRYRKVLCACALEEDLRMMPDGDSIEIGASGVNLSGGQLWRLTLACAIYSRAGILVMDDIFSAIDAHVGRHILEHVILGELGNGRTRILVTHHVGLFSQHIHYSIQLDNGGIAFSGYTDTSELVLSVEDSANLKSQVHTHQRPQPPRVNIPEDFCKITSVNEPERQLSEIDILCTEPQTSSRALGNIAFRVYVRYFKAAGGVRFWVMILAVFGIYETTIIFNSWWIALWTKSYNTTHFFAQFATTHGLIQTPTTTEFNLEGLDSNLRYYLSVYFGISIFVGVLGAFRYLLVFRGCISSSRMLFGDFTYTLLHAPLRWLDTVPLGRILNRFTADFGAIDSEMGPTVAAALNFSFRVVGIVVAGTLISPYVIIVAAFFLGMSVVCASRFLQGAREIKRLESITRSPVFETFGTLLNGITTIRASRQTEYYIDSMFTKIDAHCQTLWYMWCFNTWLTFRLGIIGAGFSAAMAVFVILLRDMTAPLAGFVLIFTLDYSDAILRVLKQYTNIELGMNSIERVLEYSEIAIEDQEGAEVSAAWPAEGALVVTDLVVGYAPDLPPILNALTFSVMPNERVGIVGRTGAGKSSLALALLRVLEAREGSISIDGLDISKLKLHHLRSRLSIIAQDPVLFSGTIRSNLDPFNSHSDEEILEALRRVYLINSTEVEMCRDVANDNIMESVSSGRNLFAFLHSPVGESGRNFSQGQRQLLCLARAIISRPKILILDEATSAVDRETDRLIQRSIREEFVNCTLIVIAHRLSTVTDFDKILVMGEGRGLEFGTPRELVEAGGVFAGMLKQSGEVLGE
ncbi:P-loop containing nucleoside triphosphate hydrolase protein [Stipitochalara longipes BDJ]|nr:P-loop containing nucleoside triphosphate hydrolase protein [Stipitochalara longipes BDJ]